MIRPLRQRHARMVLALGVFLPVAFTVSIAARRTVPAQASLPKEGVGSLAEPAVIEWERTDLFTKTPVRVRLIRGRGGARRYAVELSGATGLLKPDLLVYWVAGPPRQPDQLPEDARLLGAWDSSGAFSLPADAESGVGALVLYGLADQELVETSIAFALQKP